MGILSKFLILSVLLLFPRNLNNLHVQGLRMVDVDDFHANGRGDVDANEAFENAWDVACSSSASTVLVVPENRSYLLKQINFTGPCNSNVTFQIDGTLEAPTDPSNWNDNNRRIWLVFHKITNLVVTGGGLVDGNGHIWWENSCKINDTLPCIGAPTALTFSACKNLRVENLRVKNSQQIHILIEKSRNVQVSDMTIRAPEKSPNTDGIHVTRSRDVNIRNCDIRTGDDCVSIVSGSKNIRVSDIFCGPGHGISVGSLGKNNTEAHVRNVMVDRVIFKGTTNGARIKTWQGGHGYAKYVTFQNIIMHDVKNPIIITQNYCDSNVTCPEQPRAVAIKHVLFKNITGTSVSKVSVKLDCSRSVPCRQVQLQDIYLVGEDGASTESLCNNVCWMTTKGKVVPDPCV